MDIHHLESGRRAVSWDPGDGLPESGFIWIDIVRENEPAWPQSVQQVIGVDFHENHVTDSLNVDHPPYADSTSQYDMLIFRGVGKEPDASDPGSHQTTFFLADRALITVRPAESRSVPAILERMTDGRSRIPRRPAGLMHLLLTAMVDRFLAMRASLSMQLDELRTPLLDPDDPMNDWSVLMDYRSRINRLELLCEAQEDAITIWRDSTSVEFDEHLRIRFNDLLEHVRRVLRFSVDKQREVESLVQIHFSMVANRTNEVVRVLTVISAIFLPLTLVAGIFGMNFEHMPELAHPYGYLIALGGMIVLACALLGVFRYKQWV